MRRFASVADHISTESDQWTSYWSRYRHVMPDNPRCLPTALATRLPLTSGLQKMSTNIRLQWQGCLQDTWVYQYCSVFLLWTLSGTIVTSHLVARARFVAEIHPERGFPCSCRQKKKKISPSGLTLCSGNGQKTKMSEMKGVNGVEGEDSAVDIPSDNGSPGSWKVKARYYLKHG